MKLYKRNFSRKNHFNGLINVVKVYWLSINGNCIIQKAEKCKTNYFVSLEFHTNLFIIFKATKSKIYLKQTYLKDTTEVH